MSIRILVGDVRERLAELPDDSVHCVVTSPPYYGLRDYGVDGQIGLEPTLTAYIETMVDVFREVRRVLRPDGVCWLNIGDSYSGMYSGRNDAGKDIGGRGGNLAGSGNPGGGQSRGIAQGFKPKDLMMVPARLALALQADGWWLRSDIIWHKPNPMPESVTDRPTNAHEHIFLLTKSARYWYDADAVREENAINPNWDYPKPKHVRVTDQSEFKADGRDNKVRKSAESGWSTFSKFDENGMPTGGRNLRNVWSISTVGYPGAHFATFPPEIPRRCIKAGTSEHGCCSACGAPWSRVVDIGEPDKETTRGRQAWTAVTGQRDNAGGLPNRPRSTSGWQPGCTCDADVIPCTVIDPFFGAGTTGLVADQLGRDCIGIELNPAYASMAEDRIRAAAPMFAEVSA